MSKMKKFFKGLGVISVPALCVYAIVGAVVIPLLIFETGASKESNPRAEDRSEKHWVDNFQELGTDNKPIATDTLASKFSFKEHKNAFKVDGRDSTIYELTGPKKADGNDGDVINKNSDKLMIFSHGLNSTHWNVMESAFYWAALGYRVISWDQRGGGDNRDSHITFGYSEAGDLNNLYKVVTGTTTGTDADKIHHEFKDIKNIVMYGQSNGAATVISFADRFQGSIKAAENESINTKFIEESGYTSPKRQFETALNLHGIMPAAVVPLTIPMYELYADKNLSDENADYLAQSDQIKQPLFIVHGDDDPIVDFQMGVDLYKKMKDNQGPGATQNALPSIYIGKGLGHIGVSRESDINNKVGQVAAIEAFFKDLVTIPQSSIPQGSTEITIDNNTHVVSAVNKLKNAYPPKANPTQKDILAGYPDAVRFFYRMFLWDRFGIAHEEGGGHLG